MSEYGEKIAAETLRIERMLPGPIERLWQYLVDSDRRREWLAAGELVESGGAPLELVFRNNDLSLSDDMAPEEYAHIGDEARLHCRVIDCEAPRQLTLAWGGADGAASQVCFELAPQGDQVLLVVTHSRLDSRREMISVAAGWHSHLGILEARLRGKVPPSFWAEHKRVEAEYEQRLEQ